LPSLSYALKYMFATRTSSARDVRAAGGETGEGLARLASRLEVLGAHVAVADGATSVMRRSTLSRTARITPAALGWPPRAW
jgi:hypothetical protein